MRRGLDTLIFNLLILGYLCDKMGRVWRRRSTDLYIIEITTTAPLPMGFTREEEAQSQGVSEKVRESECHLQILNQQNDRAAQSERGSSSVVLSVNQNFRC